MTQQEELKLKLKQAALKAAAAKARERLNNAPKSSASKTTKTKTTAKTDTAKHTGGASYVIPASFKEKIENYLKGRKDVDLTKSGKSIDGCCEYIYDAMLIVAEKARNGKRIVGMYEEPEKIFNLAVHYYDESDEELKKQLEEKRNEKD